MQKFTIHRGYAIPLKLSNVDTDQIIPAKFCVGSSKFGHEKALFSHWREDPQFVLNKKEHGKASILIAGDAFGIGSSREYAVWALQNYGFKVIIASGYGDIFYNNALANGLLTIILPLSFIKNLWDLIEQFPNTEVTIDLLTQKVQALHLNHLFIIDEHIRERLLTAMDMIDCTLENIHNIIAYEKKHFKTCEK